MIRIVVEGERATAYGPFKLAFLSTIAGLRGKKVWSMDKSVTFPATVNNISLLKGCSEEIDWELKESNAEVFAELSTQQSIKFENFDYIPKTSLRDYQDTTLTRMNGMKGFAVLWEMGLGKTALAITEAGRLYSAGAITGLLVIAPNGVHGQWLAEQIPAHWDERYKVNLILWNGKLPRNCELSLPEQFNILSLNIDSLRVGGFDAAEDFLKRHYGKSMMVIDESHLIKTKSASRTQAAFKLGHLASYKRIMTGTPIAKNLLDAWTQFNWLDPAILKCPYITTFKSRYCLMGGWENKQIVGHKNVEDFYARIDKFSSRLTKKEVLSLPEKAYQIVPYQMGDKTRKHYASMKRDLLTKMEDGTFVSVANVAASLVRLQQILSGYLPVSEEAFDVFSKERLDVLMNTIEQINGPIIIWAKFKVDIVRIHAALEKAYGEDSAVMYYGETDQKDRPEVVRRFLSGEARFFVSNPSAGGVGLNLQGECQDVIYYCNSFKAVDRWQSEDRTHRLGTKGAVTYYDIIAERSIDNLVLRNLKTKKDLSDMTLDTIRLALEE